MVLHASSKAAGSHQRHRCWVRGTCAAPPLKWPFVALHPWGLISLVAIHSVAISDAPGLFDTASTVGGAAAGEKRRQALYAYDSHAALRLPEIARRCYGRVRTVLESAFPARRRHSWLPCCLNESSVPVGLGATFATASHQAAGRNVSAKEFLSSKTVSSRVGSQLDSLPVWVYRAAMMRRCLGTAGGAPCGFGAADMHHHKPACAHLPQPVQEPLQLEDDGAVCKV